MIVCFSVKTEAFELFGYHLWGENLESNEDSSTGIPDPTPYSVEFLVKSENTEEVSDTESDLQSASLLVQDIKQLPSGTSGVLARATKDFERLIGKLYGEGYYGALVNISVAGMPLNQAILYPEKITDRPVPIHIEVVRGPLFHFGQVTLQYRGPVSSHDLQLPTAQSADLLEGGPALSAKVLNAETRAITAVKDNGYPFAKVGDRSLLANHASQSLKVTLVIDSGPYAKFGPVTVSGAEKMDAGFVQEYANIPQGAQWDTKTLVKAEKRLRGLDVFSSVRLQPADNFGPDGELPLEIVVVERPKKVFGFGANYSSNEGAGVEGYWRHRNLFGKAERLSITGAVGQLLAVDNEQIEYSARLTFEKLGIFDPTTSFSTSLAVVQENPDNFRSKSLSYDVYLQKYFSETLNGRFGGEIFYANERDVFGDNEYLFIGIPAELTYDTRNSKLNPIRGGEAKLSFEPAYNMLGDDGMFFSQGSVSGYLPIIGADRVVLAGRASTGVIGAASVQDIPASRRFFLGGGGTIRGYAHKNVGPRLNDEVIGGRSFILLNGEIRTRITENIGVVGFIDAGAVFESQLPSFDSPFSFGVGGGLRYFTPVGPLRLDIGVPLEPEQNDPPFAVYVGLSQSF